MQHFKALTISILVLFLNASAGAGETTRGIGRVVTVKGTVTLGGSPLSVGDYVKVGDVIQTQADGEVKLLLNDRSIVDVLPSSSFKVKNFAQNSGPDRVVEGDVDFGQIRSNITKKLNKKGRFQIKTKSSVLAVRGTEVFVQEENGQSKITCTEGRVWVNTPGGSAETEKILTPGQQANFVRGVRENASAGAPIRLASLPQREVTQFTMGRTVRDDTFKKYVTYNEVPTERRGTASEGGRTAPEETRRRDKPAEKDTVGKTIEDTLNDTVLDKDKSAPVVDTKQIDGAGITRNPAENVKPVNDPLNNVAIIRVKIE